jgi:hypothetical protein
VLETVRVSESIAIYPLPEEQRYMKTYLVWRQGEGSLALRALQTELLESEANHQGPYPGPNSL